MNRKIRTNGYALLILSLIIMAVGVGAIVYVYRDANISITINDNSQASDVAAAGFYRGGNDELPTLTSLNNSITYGNN